MATKKQIRNLMTKLSLAPGDVLVVHDAATLNQLRSIDAKKMGIDFVLPILFAPDGIDKVPAAYLRQVADKAESGRIIIPS